GAIALVMFVGLWRGLSRTPAAKGTRVAIWLVVTATWASWFLLIRWFALNETFVLRPFMPGGPRLLLAVLVPPLVAALVCITWSRSVALFLDSIPVSWLIGIQVVRVFGANFLVGWAKGTVPGVFAWEAGTLDIIVGLMALPVARLAASGARVGHLAGVAWNLLGLADMAAGVIIVVLFGVLPEVMGVSGASRVGIGTYPLAMIPALFVANAIIWHGLSLWQLKRRGKTDPLYGGRADGPDRSETARGGAAGGSHCHGS